MAINNTPYEDDECIAFSAWLKLNHIPHTHIPNESKGNRPTDRRRQAKMKAMGQAKGFWDYLVFIPFKGVSDEIDTYQLVAIEMKRQKGGTTSEAQKTWREIYEKSGLPAKVCKGAAEAIKFVECILKGEGDGELSGGN